MARRIYRNTNPDQVTTVTVSGFTRSVTGYCVGLSALWCGSIVGAGGTVPSLPPSPTAAAALTPIYVTDIIHAINAQAERPNSSYQGVFTQVGLVSTDLLFGTGLNLLRQIAHQTNSGTLMILSKPSHAMGVYKFSLSGFYVFDPDRGLYLCDSGADFFTLITGWTSQSDIAEITEDEWTAHIIRLQL